MKILLKILSIFVLILIVFTNSTYAAPYKADAKTKRIPAGTKLKFELLDNLHSSIAYEGYPFSAALIEDQKSETSIILPAGSIVRGNIRKLVTAKRLSRGAIMYLDFDHVVTPSGRQLPLSFSIYNRNDIDLLDGGIHGSGGYGEAVKKNWEKTVGITKSATKWGAELGENAFTGANFITVPICAVAGATGGFIYFTADSVADLFRKGADVELKKGTILDVTLTCPIDVPIN